jgi:large subunit ribosomal protein L29
MKRSELAELTIEELQNKLSDNETELANLRFQKALQQLERTSRIKDIRREIAQIKTVLHEVELGVRETKGES